MEQTTFEKEWEKVGEILKHVQEDKRYVFRENNLKMLCEGMYMAGKSEGLEYAINKIK